MTCSTTRSTNVAMGDLQVRGGTEQGGGRRTVRSAVARQRGGGAAGRRGSGAAPGRQDARHGKAAYASRGGAVGSAPRRQLMSPVSPGRARWSDDADHAAVALAAELDGARGQREQCVVVPATHAVTGVDLGAALAHQDLAGEDGLAAEALDAKALEIGRASC